MHPSQSQATSGNAARDNKNKKTRIIPRHLQLAIRNDQRGAQQAAEWRDHCSESSPSTTSQEVVPSLLVQTQPLID